MSAVKTIHAAASPLTGALCGNLYVEDSRIVSYRVFVKQGESRRWVDHRTQAPGRRCRTCLKVARIALSTGDGA